MLKDEQKEKSLGSNERKTACPVQGNPNKLATDLSLETREFRRQWDDVFKVLYKKTCQPNMKQPAKLSYKNESKIKTFPDKQKLRESVASRPIFQETLKEVLQSKIK